MNVIKFAYIPFKVAPTVSTGLINFKVAILLIALGIISAYFYVKHEENGSVTAS